MQQPVNIWLDELAARTPTPGGGAAAALAAATGAALIGMVTAYTTGPKWLDREARMRELEAEAATLRTKSLELAEADAAVFKLLQAAYKLPRYSQEEKTSRSRAIQAALVKAAGPPSEIAQLSSRLVEICKELVTSANPNVLSDVGVAASLTKTALESAIINIEVNARLMHDESQIAALTSIINDAEHAAVQAQKVVNDVRKKL